MNDEDNLKNMLTVFQKIGELDERTKKTDENLHNFQTRIESRLKDIDKKLEQDLENIHTEMNDEFKTVKNTLQEILDTKNQFKGSKKTLTIIFSSLIILSGLFAWVADRWAAIKHLLF